MTNAQVPSWTEENGRLEKIFEFASFAETMAFMLRVSYVCEQLDHHPEWKNVYTRLWVSLTTHSARNIITAKDRTLAKEMDAIYEKFAQ